MTTRAPAVLTKSPKVEIWMIRNRGSRSIGTFRVGPGFVFLFSNGDIFVSVPLLAVLMLTRMTT